MKLTTPRYTLSLFFQLSFLFCDLIFNCVSLFPRSRDGLLVLFIFQDMFLVLSITSMLMTFFSTYLFQAGLVTVVARRFLCVVASSGAYLLASVCLHAASLLATPPPAAPAPPPPPPPASAPLLLLYTLHRCLSPWYYFSYKRAALRVSDPRLYEDIDWLPTHAQHSTHTQHTTNSQHSTHTQHTTNSQHSTHTQHTTLALQPTHSTHPTHTH